MSQSGIQDRETALEYIPCPSSVTQNPKRDITLCYTISNVCKPMRKWYERLLGFF